jgi:hypothetical protein
MTDIPSSSPAWVEAATRAAAELGLGEPATLEARDWARVSRRAGEILAGQGHPLPPGWDGALARAVGRPGPGATGDELARDEADTVLAEKGEVFAPEDDA